MPPGVEFAKPITLVVPHCFSEHRDEAMESLTMLGAPHGKQQAAWECTNGYLECEVSPSAFGA